MSLISPNGMRSAVCTDEWWCALASGIDMKSTPPQSRKMENKAVGVNELLMPRSAHYVSCWWPARTIPVSCCKTLPKTSVCCVLPLLCSFFPPSFFFSPQILDYFLFFPRACNVYIWLKVTVVFQTSAHTLVHHRATKAPQQWPFPC